MELTMRNEIATPELAALTADEEKTLDWKENDNKMILVINNTGSAATTLTVKAGNGIQGVCDLTLAVPVGVSLVKLESGRFKFVSGDNKGKIIVVSPGTPKVGVAALV